MKKTFTQFFLVAAMLFLSGANLFAQQIVDGVWCSLYDTEEYAIINVVNNYTKEFTLPAPGDQLSFEAHKATLGWGNLFIEEYVNGEWNSVVDYSLGNKYSSYSTGISTSATKIRFRVKDGSSLNRTFKNVKVRMASFSNAPADAMWVAPTAEQNSPAEEASTTMVWCNVAPFVLSLTGEGADQFEVKIEQNAEYGKHGTATISAIYHHTDVGEHEALLTISNGNKTYEIELSGVTTHIRQTPVITDLPVVNPISYGQLLTNDMLVGGTADVEGHFEWGADVNQELLPGEYDLAVRFVPNDLDLYLVVDATVHVVVNKAEQTITWDDDIFNATVGQTVMLTATAVGEVWYETYESEIAWINDNTVTFLSAGTATIYAIAGETDYFLGDTISKTITVTPKLDENIVTALPTATTITYGQLLKESHLEGGESTVEGTFRWFDGDVFLNAGKHTMTVIFEPVEQEIYEVVELPVEVEVLPAEQTMTWELESLVLELGEVIELNASISSDLLVTYSVDNTEVLQVVDNLLYAVGLGEATVTAMQDGMDEFGTPNYQPVSMNYVITVVSDNTGTSLDAIKVDGNATKIIRNGQLLIIRGEHIFDTLGNMMK